GITASTQSAGYCSNTWGTTVTTEALAISGNTYYQCTINAVATMSVSLSTLDYRLRRTSTAPDSIIWRYSTDGINFTNIGSVLAFTTTGTNGDQQTQINLSTISALQNVPNSSTITLRLYAWAAGSNAGTLSFGIGSTNSLAIGGAIAATS